MWELFVGFCEHSEFGAVCQAIVLNPRMILPTEARCEFHRPFIRAEAEAYAKAAGFDVAFMYSGCKSLESDT